MKAGRIEGNRKSTATSSSVLALESTLVAVAAMAERFGHVRIYSYSTMRFEEFQARNDETRKSQGGKAVLLVEIYMYMSNVPLSICATDDRFNIAVFKRAPFAF